MPDEPNPDPSGDSRRRAYLKGLLRDLDALERMLEGGVLESGVRRIGAEQEVAIVDRSGGPSPSPTNCFVPCPRGPSPTSWADSTWR